MRKLALTAAILPMAAFLLGLAPGAEPDQPATHEFTSKLLSIDIEKHTIILENPDGRVLMVPVEGDALSSIEDETVKQGDRVAVTCREDDEGYCKVVTKLARVS